MGTLTYGPECPACRHQHPFVDGGPKACDVVARLSGSAPGQMRAEVCGCTAKPGDPPSITCPECGMTSYHPTDIVEGYCGACHWWTSNPMLVRARAEARAV